MKRRDFLAKGAAGAAALLASCVPHRSRPLPNALAMPSAAQLAWQRDELAMFLHFGVNTFTDREWGDGREDPAIFAPTRLDARQWARTARNAGFRAMILTAKHHDGFCLWPTATTSHSVAASPFRGGRGDVVREFVDACRAEGLRPGLYLSPWDRNNPAYGDSPRSNALYCAQLPALLTRYGSLAEVWFDGANGEGPNGRRQVYDWPRVWNLVRRLQPNAVVFSDAGPDVRWCGNENGVAGDPNWSAMDPAAVAYPGVDGPGIGAALQHGDPHGTVWRPAEADVSIRPGWFYHPADDAKVRTVDGLLNWYATSVGRNSKLLLNVPPTRDGVLHDIDAARLSSFGDRLRTVFANDLAQSRRPTWHLSSAASGEATIDLGAPARVGLVRLEESIGRGQTIARYTCYASNDGDWRVLSRGTTIGYARLDRFPPADVRRLRVVVEEAVGPPAPLRIRAYPPV